MEELTTKQDQLCDTIFAEYDNVLTKLPKPNKAAIAAWLKCVYGLYDLPVPTDVRICDSPAAALALASAITNAPQGQLNNCGISESGWVAFHDYFNRIGILTDAEVADTLALRDFQRGCWDTFLMDTVALVVRFPVRLKRDNEGNLHSAKGPCIVWADGNKDWAWHGVWVEERVITDPSSYTAKEYTAATTEVRRAIGESAGWDFVVSLLGATSVDVWVDPNSQLCYELFQADGAKWIRKQSPRLQNGKQPFYFEPVHENLKTAQAARKWQSARTMTPEQCEADPTLVYGIET